MVEKYNDSLKRKDLDLILEVNKKAIEIETEVAEQNEEVISSLDEIKKSLEASGTKLDAQDEKLDKIISSNDSLDKDLFRMQVLYIGGLLALVTQIVQIFLKK